MIRLLDILFSAIGLVLLSPLFVLFYILVWMESKGGGFFVQERIGKDGKPFGLYKFRSMKTKAEAEGQITVGAHDTRITRIGYFLRKYKLDELPQLWNVLKGDMSIVGLFFDETASAEIYTDEQRKVLTVRPGITDHASIRYINENEILCRADDPERVYIEQIMPDKIKLNMVYIEHHTLREYLRVILLTLKSLLS